MGVSGFIGDNEERSFLWAKNGPLQWNSLGDELFNPAKCEFKTTVVLNAHRCRWGSLTLYIFVLVFSWIRTIPRDIISIDSDYMFTRLIVMKVIMICLRIQWRIQDFPEGGREPSRGGVNTPNFPENCMKSKEFGRPGGACVPHAPP